ncbi:ankyrin repeat domain-containing protein [Candidatus Dependentiae bacterium]|nr:ankyrin repeat domain-containing protein [Candidatus Dependentiae bacterium]
MKTILDHGANLNYANPQDWTALHQAVYPPNPQAIKLLLEREANPLAKNNLGRMPFDIAKKHIALLKKIDETTTLTKKTRQELQQTIDNYKEILKLLSEANTKKARLALEKHLATSEINGVSLSNLAKTIVGYAIK